MKKIILLFVCVFVNTNIKCADINIKIESEATTIRKAQITYWFNAFVLKLSIRDKIQLQEIINLSIKRRYNISGHRNYSYEINEAICELNKNKNINGMDLDYIFGLFKSDLISKKK